MTKAVPVAVKCRICRDTFSTVPEADGTVPNVCGRPRCRTSSWSPVEWAGRARMAEARQAAGLPLDDTDRSALRMTLKEAE